MGCAAPNGTEACEQYCEARRRCTAEETEAECLWHCFARVERAHETGSQCSRAMRCEVDCLSGLTDCDQLFDERIGRNEPCFVEADLRKSHCGDF